MRCEINTLQYSISKSYGSSNGSKCKFALRIHRIHRIISDIGIEIDPASQPNGISGHVAAGGRIVVPVEIIMQPGLRIKVLAREAQVAGNGLGKHLGLAKGQISGLPENGAVAVDDPAGRSEVIGQNGIESGMITVDLHGNGQAAKVKIIPERITLAVDLGYQVALEIIVVIRGLPPCALLDPPVKAVIAVLGHKGVALVHLDQPMQTVVGIGEDRVRGNIAAV